MLSKRSGTLAFWAATLAAMALVALLIAPDHDGDDVLRLLQVRAWLDGQSWFDLTQYRIDPPHGVAMHWTRWVDLPIALCLLVLRPLLGAAQAESAVLVIVPLATLAALAGATYALTKPWFGERAAVIAVLLIAATPAVTLQIHPQRIDHHGWQIVLAVAALGLLLDRTRRSAVLFGGVLALWLAISIEALPMVAAFLGVLGLDWLHDLAQRWRLVLASRWFAASSVLLWLASHGFPARFNWCDTVAPAHLFGFVLAALGVQVLARLNPLNLLQRLAGLALAATIAAASFLTFAPQCAAGAFAQLDPLVAKVWLAQVTEARPVWEVSPVLAVTLLSPAFAGLAVLLFSSRKAEGDHRAMLFAYALILAAATLLGCVVIRASASACALALPPLAWQIARWLPGSDPLASPQTRVMRLLGIVLVALPWVPASALVRAMIPDKAASANAAFTCKPELAAAGLAQLPRGTVLTPFDYAAELLAAGPHAVVASPHHRGMAAMRWTIETFQASPDAARVALGARGVEYVAVCPGQPELVNYTAAAPHGLGAVLARGAAPDWLEAVPMPAASGLRVWRVRAQTIQIIRGIQLDAAQSRSR